MHKTSNEHGQVLIFLVLAMVGLLGFTALAIDGGNIFMTRRQAQNAADSAAMAAALAKIKGQDWQAAGFAVSAQNGFANDDSNVVVVVSPPQEGRYAPPFAGANHYVQVIITSTLETSFAQFVYSGDVVNTVQAVARVQLPTNLFPGNALHATNETACKAIWFAGNGAVDIIGGNVFSNSTASGTPEACHAGVKSGSAGNISVSGGGILAAGTFRNQSGATIYAEDGIQEGVDQQPLPQLPVPDCSHLPTRSYPGGDAVLEPGWYPNGIKVTGANTRVTLNEGMYCFGKDFTANGGEIRSAGDGVFLYMDKGAFDLGGNTLVVLRRASDVTDAAGYQWGGMLLYLGPNNTSLVTITGTSGSSYTGTIYAPAPASPSSQAKCTISGTGESLALNSQVICNTVKTDGNSKLFINYNEEDNFHLPPIIELVQ